MVVPWPPSNYRQHISSWLVCQTCISASLMIIASKTAVFCPQVAGQNSPSPSTARENGCNFVVSYAWVLQLCAGRVQDKFPHTANLGQSHFHIRQGSRFFATILLILPPSKGGCLACFSRKSPFFSRTVMLGPCLRRAYLPALPSRGRCRFLLCHFPVTEPHFSHGTSLRKRCPSLSRFCSTVVVKDTILVRSGEATLV